MRLSSSIGTKPAAWLTCSVSSLVMKGARPNFVIYAVLLLPHEKVAAMSESGNIILKKVVIPSLEV